MLYLSALNRFAHFLLKLLEKPCLNIQMLNVSLNLSFEGILTDSLTEQSVY